MILLTTLRIAWASFKYHKRYHFFFILSLILIFTFFFFIQAVYFSLDFMEEQLQSQPFFTKLVNLFAQGYQNFTQKAPLLLFFSLFLLIASKEWTRKKEYLIWLNNGGQPWRLVAIQLLESTFLLILAALSFLFLLVVFSPFFKSGIMRLCQIVINQNPTLNNEFNLLFQTEGANQLNLHFASSNQMIEHLFFALSNQGEQVLFKAYFSTFLWLIKLFILLHTIITSFNILGRNFNWKNKNRLKL